MTKQKSTNRNKTVEKVFSIVSVILLIAAWSLGGLRTDNSQSQFFKQVLASGEQAVEVSPRLFKVVPDGQRDAEPLKWIGIGAGVGYGGELTVGGVFLSDGQVETIALLSSKETASYFDKVVDEKLPDGLLEQNIARTLSIDAVSGATLTSDAYTHALNQAADPVRAIEFNYQLSDTPALWEYLKWLDLAAVLFFGVAVWVNKTRSPYKAKMNGALLFASTVVFGFYSASLYSASTMGGLIFGSWLTGVANYTPFILLALSLGYIVYYNRNVYCQSLCPFGAVQQCLAKVGNAKSSPVRHQFFVWLPRVILLATLCLGAYFRNPAGFVYEPFGIAFGMIGGMYLFVLTVLIVLTSLVVRRPWCQSLCPINAMTDFVVFNKNWFKQMRSQPSKKKRASSVGDNAGNAQRSRQTERKEREE
ncbi:4Fe-4S binding protein [Enterovibrio norvegicus]|uniref:FMN-binding protein n=1 Tax=Enterovibrio norvegicus TaxID=188144 RepID=UPI003D09A80C